MIQFSLGLITSFSIGSALNDLLTSRWLNEGGFTLREQFCLSFDGDVRVVVSQGLVQSLPDGLRVKGRLLLQAEAISMFCVDPCSSFLVGHFDLLGRVELLELFHIEIGLGNISSKLG